MLHNYLAGRSIHSIEVQTRSAPQNDLSFVKDIYVDGEKLTRNGQKTATYYAASFLSHYRRVLFLHLLVFNLRLICVFCQKGLRGPV